MKKIIYFLMAFGSFIEASYCQTPSDIQRTKIEVEQGDVDLHRAHAKIQLGAGQASSHGGFKEGEAKLSTKFIIGGSAGRERVSGFAIAPDLIAKLRLDESGKIVRLELGGKIISVADIQFLYYKSKDNEKLLSSFYPSELINIQRNLSEIKDLEEILQRQKQKKDEEKNLPYIAEIESKLKVLKQDSSRLEAMIKEDKEVRMNAIPFASADVSFLNLGAKYKEIKDANFKFVGPNASAMTASFDFMAKSKNDKIRFGICGILDVLTFKYGEMTSDNSKGKGTMGLDWSVCLKFAYGPIIFNNTVSGNYDKIMGNDKVTDYDNRTVASINNNARVGVRTGIIPGTTTEVGAFYNYSKEWYPGKDIDSHMVGGGITVMPK